MNVKDMTALTIVAVGFVSKFALADAAVSAPLVLDAVMVTAQKVRQNVLEVPATVEVVNAEDLALRQIDSMENLGKAVGGLHVLSNTGGQPRIYLRGMGDAFDLKNKRLAVYVDGVPQLDSVLENPMLLDSVERVEVLKGPQGTLYGRNSSAGVINIVTRQPTGDTASGFLGAGDLGQWRGGVALSKSLLKDQLRFGVNAAWTRRDGVLENLANGSSGKLDGETHRHLDIKADFRPTDKTRLNVSFSHFEDDSGPFLQTFIDPRSLEPIRRDAGVGFTPIRFHQIDRDTEGRTKIHGTGIAFKASHDFDLFQLNSITSYQQDRLRMVSDADFSSNRLFKWDFDPYINDHWQASQEFQLVGRAGAVRWQTGLFAYRDQTDNSNVFKTNQGNLLTESRYRTTGAAWYGQMDYVFAPRWTATVGGRLQRDWQKLKDVQRNSTEISNANTSGTYKLALAYAFLPNNTTFLTFGTGYTPGGVNTTPQMINGLPVGPYLGYAAENSSGIEWGIKGWLSQQRLGYSLSLYDTLLSNQQVLNRADTQIKNIGATRYRGVELSLNYRIAGPWSVDAGYALNTSSIRTSNDPEELGKSVPFVPRETARVGVQFQDRIGDALTTLRLDMNHVGRIEADARNSLGQSGYQLLSLTGKADFKRWWLGLAIDNVLDKQYYSNLMADSPFPGTHAALYGRPRTWLLTLGARL